MNAIKKERKTMKKLGSVILVAILLTGCGLNSAETIQDTSYLKNNDLIPYEQIKDDILVPVDNSVEVKDYRVSVNEVISDEHFMVAYLSVDQTGGDSIKDLTLEAHVFEENSTHPNAFLISLNKDQGLSTDKKIVVMCTARAVDLKDGIVLDIEGLRDSNGKTVVSLKGNEMTRLTIPFAGCDTLRGADTERYQNISLSPYSLWFEDYTEEDSKNVAEQVVITFKDGSKLEIATEPGEKSVSGDAATMEMNYETYEAPHVNTMVFFKQFIDISSVETLEINGESITLELQPKAASAGAK